MNNKTNKSLCKEENYKEVYESIAQLLRNYLFYKTKDLSAAEDLMHEAFAQLWENCKDVSSENAKAFLFRVSNNKFVDGIRKLNAKRNFIDFSNEKFKIETSDPEKELRKKEFKAQLDHAISDLSDKQREVFLMNRIDKLKYKEIAETLGISVKAVEKRMHVALVKLSESLEGYKI